MFQMPGSKAKPPSRGGSVASAAEIILGADSAKIITPAALLAALGTTGIFTSAAQTITSGGLLTLAHGLGRIPKHIKADLKCVTIQNNWAVNDIYQLEAQPGDTGNASGRGCAFYADTTNVYVRYGGAASTFCLLDKTTGGTFATTNASWNLLVTAWG